MEVTISPAARATPLISLAVAIQMAKHTLKMAHDCGFNIFTGDTYHRRFTVGGHRFVCSVSGDESGDESKTIHVVRMLSEVPGKNWVRHGEKIEVTS